MSLGLKKAGYKVVGAVEIDDLAVETYRSNHADVFLEPRDILETDAQEFARRVLGKRRRIDLLAACPPCQGFSQVRTLKSATAARDCRNRLVLDVLRFVHSLKPRAILFENVPGLEKDWRFGELRRQLQRLGYSVEHGIVDAADYGVAQRRRRLLLVAVHRKGVNLSNFFSRRLRRRTVRQAWRPLERATRAHDPLHEYDERRSQTVMRRIKKIPKDGGSRRDLPPRDQLRCHTVSDGFYDIYGRIAWDDVAPTITGGCINPSKGRFLHPKEDRAITLREAALLQSFPPSYRFSLRRGRYAAAEMIGNALPPRVVACQARALRRRLSC
jgi:DNA (cytosine-5)-methyltransferase 1